MKDTFWVEESSGKPIVCNKRKRRVGKRKLEFVGWGSRPLIEFLEVIGKDTKEKHSRHAVAGFITKYINDNRLTSAEKKKKVLCDERLFALFGKKTVPRIKVHDMLEEHFAENHDNSDDELDSSDDEGCKEKSSLGLKFNPTGQKKKVSKTPKSCFAAIIPENIKLIYLKKSLIKELLKFPENYESKVIGGFVRMKSDPNDIFQKNPFQLQQVTGVEKVCAAGDADTEIHLRVANFFREIRIDMLSDDDFSEEEVEDVRDRIKAGSLNRLTVNELQLKAQILHADITKHWIDREISLLHRRIEHASEKGWQRQKFEYIEKRKMLQTPSEQEKMMHTVPEVIAEELEPDPIAAASGEAEVNAFSPTSILRGSSDVFSINALGSGEIIAPPQVILDDSHALKSQNGPIDGIVPVNDSKGDEAAEIVDKETLVANVAYDVNNIERDGANPGENGPQAQENATSVIYVSDDDLEKEVPKTDETTIYYDSLWCYLDPQGIIRGPFSLFQLKQWSDLNYFNPQFRVWRIDQTMLHGVPLAYVLQGQNFPR